MEDLLLDIEHLSNDIEQMQFENNRIYDQPKFAKNIDPSQQPYRSEMNLILSFDGSKSTFVEERNENSGNHVMPPKEFEENLETPPPKIPVPMELLPNTLPYIKKNDKDGISTTNKGVEDECGEQTENTVTDGPMTRIPLPPAGISAKEKPNSKTNNGAIATVRRHFFPQKSNASKIKIIVDDSRDSVADEEHSSSPECSTKPRQSIAEGTNDTQPDYLAVEMVRFYKKFSS